MRRVTYAIVSLGISSIFCSILSFPMEISFISAILTVVWSALQSKYLYDMRIFFISMALLSLPAAIGIYPFIFLPILLSYLSFMLLEFLDGNVKVPFEIEVRESRLDIGFMLMFLIALFI
jgi:hypothetical protein